MGKHISSLLGVKLMGNDLMTPDISIPAGLHYHEMIANHEQEGSVGTRILEYIYPIRVSRCRYLRKARYRWASPVRNSASSDLVPKRRVQSKS